MKRGCRRGYLPDGYGVAYANRTVEFGETLALDDDATLMLTGCGS